ASRADAPAPARTPPGQLRVHDAPRLLRRRALVQPVRPPARAGARRRGVVRRPRGRRGPRDPPRRLRRPRVGDRRDGRKGQAPGASVAGRPAVAGKTRSAIAPGPSARFVRLSWAPWAWASSWQIESPSPRPAGFVVTNGSNSDS